MEAELYLKRVIEVGSGKAKDGVPSLFPSVIFEGSWIGT